MSNTTPTTPSTTIGESCLRSRCGSRAYAHTHTHATSGAVSVSTPSTFHPLPDPVPSEVPCLLPVWLTSSSASRASTRPASPRHPPSAATTAAYSRASGRFLLPAWLPRRTGCTGSRRAGGVLVLVREIARARLYMPQYHLDRILPRHLLLHHLLQLHLQVRFPAQSHRQCST